MSDDWLPNIGTVSVRRRPVLGALGALLGALGWQAADARARHTTPGFGEAFGAHFGGPAPADGGLPGGGFGAQFGTHFGE